MSNVREKHCFEDQLLTIISNGDVLFAQYTKRPRCTHKPWTQQHLSYLPQFSPGSANFGTQISIIAISAIISKFSFPFTWNGPSGHLKCPTGSFFFNIGSRRMLKKIHVGLESGRSVKINNSVLLGTLAVKWNIVHIFWNLSYFLWVLCTINSSLPTILGNTWYCRIPVTRGFSKLNRVGSGIKENIG